MVIEKNGGSAGSHPSNLQPGICTTSLHHIPPAGKRAMGNEPPLELEAHRLVDVRAVATTIGVSPRTLWRWCESGAFPMPDLKIGETRRWRVTTVLAWLERQTGGGA